MKSSFKRIAPIGTALLCLLLFSVGCYQGQPSKKPPIHINPNMDDQEKYQSQASSKFFANGQAMRMPIEGTIARGELRADVEFFTGKTARGNFVKNSPVPATMENLKRGQERFNIYCSPCHGRTGEGDGMIVKRGLIPPPTYHQQYLRDTADGYIFEVITNGVRNMPSYRSQVPVADRWAIINYVRALQHSQNARAKDVPADVMKSLK